MREFMIKRMCERYGCSRERAIKILWAERCRKPLSRHAASVRKASMRTEPWSV